MNIKKIGILFLAITLFTIGCNFIVFADVINDIEREALFLETKDGFIMQYVVEENSDTFYYDEKYDDGLITTLKYMKTSRGYEFVEEIQTVISQNFNGEWIATINNLTNKTILIETVSEGKNRHFIEQNYIAPSAYNYIWHPLHSDYYRVTAVSGHLGVKNLTQAAIVALISTAISGGSLKLGTIAGIATGVLSGGWSNLFYTEEHYYPYGPSIGKPIWKRIYKYYYDVNRSNQCGDTLYTDADILSQY